MKRKCLALLGCLMAARCVCPAPVFGETAKGGELVQLSKWSRGVKLENRSDALGFAYLWFYEWHLFGAVENKEQTRGSHNWEWTVEDDGTAARMDSEWLKMKIDAVTDGADMLLEISNTTDHDWPEIAAIIPCFNPGPVGQRNSAFLDESHEHTYFVGKDGLALIKGAAPREIHFNHEFREPVMNWKKNQSFVFSGKWPTSERDAYAGLMVRESDDKTWVMGIAWESFISSQGHNPWKCMHLSIRVGPLKKGETKKVRGKMYLFRGTREDCWERFCNDFR